jgi:hypothetical protein
MKKINLILTALTIFASLTLNSCGPQSEKGKWVEADKQKYYKEMESVDLSSLGENKTKWIDCYLQKTEANYASFTEADKDEEGCKKLATECFYEIEANGSVKGKWSESDKQKFHKEMEAADLASFGENKTKWMECYLHKMEAQYSSFSEANSDAQGCEKIALECKEEIIP